MNNIFVLKSKLIMPDLPADFILTDRLKALHQRMDSCRAVTVCAPAGYGKTTLILSYFYYQEPALSQICWYRLEPDDKLPAVFVKHFTDTLFPPEYGEFAEVRKTIDNAHGQLQTQNVIGLICQEMWKLHRKETDTRTCIVFDDFQNVAHSDDIRDIIRFLLDNLPPSCTIYLLTRTITTVFTEKQKLEKKVMDVGTDDLSFSRNEIEKLAHSMDQDVFDKNIIDSISKITEGWIAGIIIMCQNFRSKGTGAAIEAGIDCQDNLFRYISMEVLRYVDEESQNNLAKLALLHDFCDDKAVKIFENIDIHLLMKQCLDFGMFIQKISGNPIVYRFHPLFRGVLLSIVNDRFSPEQIEDLHLKAAAYYIEEAIYGRAAEHIAQCRNVEKTAGMVTEVGIKFMIIGESGQLKTWIDMLPESVISENPVLLIFKGLTMPQTKLKEAEDTLTRALELSRKQNNPEMQYRAATSLAFLYYCRNNMSGIIRATESILRLPSESLEHLYSRLGLLEMLQSIGRSMFSKGRWQSTNIRYSELSEEDQWLFLAWSCEIYLCLGELNDAERCMEAALSLNCIKNVEQGRGTALYLLSSVLLLKNNRQRLLPLLTELSDIGHKYDYLYILAGEKRFSAFERYLSSDNDNAVKLLDKAILLYQRFDNRAMTATSKLLRCLWTIQPGSNGPNLDEALKNATMIRKLKAGMLLYEISLSIIGAIAREAGDYPLAEKYLLSAIREAKKKKGNQLLCGSCMHIARLYFISGDKEKGHGYLKQAMELAAAGRYFMFWDIHIPTIVEMALRSIRYGYTSAFAEELLEKFFNRNVTKYLTEKIKTMDESSITAFTNTFISGYKENRDRNYYLFKASLFGKPEFTVNGVKIADSEWKGKKNKGLLEYMLLNCDKVVSRESLADIFWPSSDSKSALVSLRTALYQIRKILKKYHVDVSGEESFIHETPEGLLIKQGDTLELDLHSFLHLHNSLSAPVKCNTDSSQLKNILERMVYLYKGELIEGGDYGDLLFFERDKCKSVFEEACLQLSAFHIRNGELRQAEMILRRALNAEPYSENACLELLKLYISQGAKKKAFRLYNSFKKLYESDLNLKIDNRLTGVMLENQ